LIYSDHSIRKIKINQKSQTVKNKIRLRLEFVSWLISYNRITQSIILQKTSNYLVSDVVQILQIDFSLRDLYYSLSVRWDMLFTFLVFIERIVALVECLFHLIQEMLMIEFEHVWYLFHEVNDVSKGQTLTLYNFLVIWGSQIFEFLKGFFLVIENEILLLSFSSFTMYVWNFVGQIHSSDVYPLIFFTQNN